MSEQSQEGLNDDGSDQEVEEHSVPTWELFSVPPIPDHAPSWRAIPWQTDLLCVRTGVIDSELFAISNSDRWEMWEREVTLIRDEFGDIDDSQRIYTGMVVSFYVDIGEGVMGLTPPSLVLGVGDADDGTSTYLAILHDTLLEPIPMSEVPFPLDAFVFFWEHALPMGLVRRMFLDLWDLDVFCPWCGDVGSKSIPAVRIYELGTYKCATCHRHWPERTKTPVMADQDNHRHLESWTFPITRLLGCLVKAGWEFAPFEVEWNWDGEIRVTTSITRGDSLIAASFEPCARRLELTGPVEFDEGIVIGPSLSYSEVEEQLRTLIPWAFAP